MMMKMEGSVQKDLKSSVPGFARGLPILLVDHDISSLIAISLMLQSYSFNVITAQSTIDAMSIIRESSQDDQDHGFKLVMANISMEKSGDLSFLRTLVKKGIPVILISSDKNVTIDEKAFAEGACLYLEKPIGASDIKYLWQYACQRTTKPEKEDRPVEMKSKTDAAGNCSKMLYDPHEKDKETNTEAIESGMRIAIRPHFVDPKAQKGLVSNPQKAMDRPLESEKDHAAKMSKKLNNTLTDMRKRKVPDDCEDNDQSRLASGKKPRIVWTTSLHFKFTAAVCALGDKLARPKAILQLMKVPGLTVRQVASHLQKYKSQVQRITTSVETSLSSAEYLGSHETHASSQWFNTSRKSYGKESLGFESAETPIGPFGIRDDGYIYQDPEQTCYLSKPTGPSVLQHPPSSSESDLTKRSSPVATEYDIDYYNDVVSKLHESPLSIMDTDELRNWCSQLQPEQLPLQESSLNTDHLIEDTIEGYTKDSNSPTDSPDFPKHFDDMDTIAKSDDFHDILLKMLEDEPYDIPSPVGKGNLNDVNQWLQEVLQLTPNETESYLLSQRLSKL